MNTQFHPIRKELLNLIGLWMPRLKGLTQQNITQVRNSQGRSIKQIVGHMVDSATNNTHRIIHLQYQESPISYPDYANLGNNDRWIAIQNFQEEDWELLVDLWASSNRHIAHVIGQVDDRKLQRIWISALGEEVSLEAMIKDYPRHFNLHLGEIEELIKSK
jgi:predicted MPP superfamily phosphohydrolase